MGIFVRVAEKVSSVCLLTLWTRFFGRVDCVTAKVERQMAVDEWGEGLRKLLVSLLREVQLAEHHWTIKRRRGETEYKGVVVLSFRCIQIHL